MAAKACLLDQLFPAPPPVDAIGVNDFQFLLFEKSNLL
jgi:hypothetical protein